MEISVLHLNDLGTKDVDTYNSIRTSISLRKIKNIRQVDVAKVMNVDSRIVHNLEKKYSTIGGDLETAYQEAVLKILREKNNADS